MAQHIFTCIDAHTCGNSVRVVTGGAPELEAGDAGARITGFNTIVIDQRDPYAHGFEVV